MRVLIVHNDYAAPSGEEAAVDLLTETLGRNGVEVHEFRRSSSTIRRSALGLVSAAATSLHSVEAVRAFRAEVIAWRPALVHLHNLYPLISPGVVRACEALGLPTVMTLHNYRLLCPNGLFFSKGEVCERCREGSLGSVARLRG